ncbi:MAG: fatty acid desaturase [Rhizonema sp. NSF051]|nr:fatty acid desaturase [Rhizonema sp. NSF051]
MQSQTAIQHQSEQLPTDLSARSNPSTNTGLLIALSIMISWATSLVSLLCVDLSHFNKLTLLAAILGQTFLYTGLFITAHDAMHGVIFPSNSKINHLIGSVCVLLYSCFSYQKLLKNHWKHHHNPAREADPDFHNGEQKNFFAWYFHFMKAYFDWRQLIALIVVYHSVAQILHIPHGNLNYFFVIPSLLSSLQLFYFGTFLPHREPVGGYTTPSHATTISLPTWLSFIACYHFGYHEEHHEHPHAAWWQLPAIYEKRLTGASGT